MRINNKFDTLEESKNLIEEILTIITGNSTDKKDPFTGKQGIHILFKDFNSHNKLKQ